MSLVFLKLIYAIQVHKSLGKEALRLSEMTSKPASQNTRKGMIAKIDGVAYPVEFQDGDSLLYDCTVRLPKLDPNGGIVTERVKEPEIIKQDGCIDINRDVVKRKIVMETVKLKKGSIKAMPGNDTDAQNRRYKTS